MVILLEYYDEKAGILNILRKDDSTLSHKTTKLKKM